jgi:hypothetical protein
VQCQQPSPGRLPLPAVQNQSGWLLSELHPFCLRTLADAC